MKLRIPELSFSTVVGWRAASRRTRWRRTASVMVAGVLFTSCSRTSDAAPQGTISTSETVLRTTTPTTPKASSASATDDVGSGDEASVGPASGTSDQLRNLYVLYGPDDGLVSTLYATWRERVRSCLAEAGFDGYPVGDALPVVTPMPTPFEALDRDVAMEQGFVVSSWVPGTVEVTDDQKAFFTRLQSDPALSEALVGDGSQPGCGESARLDVYRNDEFYQNLGLLIDSQSELEFSFQSLPALLELESEWSQCMKNGGYAYSTRAELFQVEWAEPRPSEEERRVVAADYDCRVDVDFADRYGALWNAAVESFESEHSGELIEIRQSWAQYGAD